MRLEEVERRFSELLHRYIQKWEKIEGTLKEYEVGVGMGGSSMGLRILEDLGHITRYSTYWECLPSKPSKALLISYSGNTEEVLSYLGKVEHLGITAGGTLAQHPPVLKLDQGYVPRAGVVEMIPLLMLGYGEKKRLEEWMDYELEGWEEVVRYLEGAPYAIIYGLEYNHFPSYYMKASLNENAKMPVSWALLPEDNHNGLEGLPSHIPIVILGTPNNKRVKKRIAFLQEEFGALHLEGTPLELAHLSLKVSLELARKKGITPEDTPRVARLKTYLKA
ncbi:MAG: hypothetical protein GXN92_02450 [Candidatus Micrarchaeota archaeon]|nr:hypothetical protein [Candidatus Micrarchaeota archaeon]